MSIPVNASGRNRPAFGLGSLVLVASLACSPVAMQPNGTKSRATPAAITPQSVAPAKMLPEPPPDARCIVRGEVTHSDVVWKLRTRLDAIRTMQVEEGRVTGFLQAGKRRGEPYALAEVENSSMLIRAFVATEDLEVVVSKAYESLPGYFPDGFRHRPVLEVQGDETLLAIDMEGAVSTGSYLACETLGLVPRDLGAERSLPPARGEVVVKKGVSVKTPDGFYPIDGLGTPWGPSSPEGILGELRGDDTDPLARLVSFKTCGGVVLGFVPKSHLLGPPKLMHGSSAQCPNVGASVFAMRGPIQRPVKCPREIPVFLRSQTLEDPVGILRAGAKFELHGEEAGGTRLIWVDLPPAVPLEGFSFSVRVQDLEDCAPA